MGRKLASDAAKRDNLRLNGARPDEIEFLLRQRMELNALRPTNWLPSSSAS